MDYVARQFIVLAKKLRKDLRKSLDVLHADVSRLISILSKQQPKPNNVCEAIDDRGEPQIIRAELSTPVAIAVQNEPKDSHPNWQRVKTVVEIVGILAALTYAYVAVRQWREMIAVRHQAQGAIDAANRSASAAETANRNAVESERPWVGMSIVIQNWADDKTRKAVVFFTNSGRRPAKATLVQLGKHAFRIFPQNPLYETFTTDVKSIALILPNSFVSNAVPLTELTQARLTEPGARRDTFFVYSNIEYEDVLSHAKHWTHACWQYFTGFENGTYGFVNCSSYNAVDEERR
jgi:hypothetical protein